MRLKKSLYNRKFANWYYGLHKEIGGEIKRFKDGNKIKLFPGNDDSVPKTYFNKGDRISSCCDLWVWDVYHQNKLMDLKKLNRCMNSRFCPNCKMLNVAKFIHEFKSKVPSLAEYDFYLLTLTIPSEKCDGEVLRSLIDKLYLTFRKLNHKYSLPLLTPTGKKSNKALQDRYFDFDGGVRVLEITHNKKNGFHPHLHCIVCVRKDSIDKDLLEKNIKGKWSTKRDSRNMKSLIDMQIGKAWTMLWYGVDFRKWDKFEYSVSDTYAKIDDDITQFKNLEVDFSSMDDGGVYEVFKYTFKSSEVSSFNVFKALEIAMAYKRIRQGFGVLHDLKCDDDSDGEYQELVLEFEEEPVEVLTKEFDELLTTFADYRKVSRFQPKVKEEFLLSIAD